MISSVVKVVVGHHIRSPAPSPRPLRWVSRSRTVISAVTYESYMRKSGRCLMTGSSHASLPWSTSIASPAAVKAFELDAISKMVLPSTLAGSPSLRTPKPRAAIT